MRIIITLISSLNFTKMPQELKTRVEINILLHVHFLVHKKMERIKEDEDCENYAFVKIRACRIKKMKAQSYATRAKTES